MRRKKTLLVSRTRSLSRTLVCSVSRGVNTEFTRDSGVFTSIIRRIGVLGVEVKEIVSIEPEGIDHLRCGLISLVCLTSFLMK